MSHPKNEPFENTMAMTPANPTAAEIREVIASLRTLADTFPGIIHAANGPGLSGSPMNTMGALDRAVEMLRLHASREQDRETEREKQRSDERDRLLCQTARETRERGIAIGIEQEKARAKEARKGRKKTAPAKGAK